MRTAQRPLTLAEIQRGITEAADLPLSRARTIPAQAYTSEEFFEWEVTCLLRGGWQCAAHVSQIPDPGDFLNLELLGEPIIVVRGKDGAIRALSRACPHRAWISCRKALATRGTIPRKHVRMPPVAGMRGLLLCPYHAWTFELDGRLKACPEMQEAEGFSREDFGLRPFRSEVWQGFIFVNLDGNAEPIGEGLTEMEADVAPYRLADLKLVVAREWDCSFNWKVIVGELHGMLPPPRHSSSNPPADDAGAAHLDGTGASPLYPCAFAV